MAIFSGNSKLVLVGLTLVFTSCKESTESSAPVSDDLSGKEIYMQKCISCHGKNGDLGVSGAADLSKSSLSSSEKIQFIKEGSPNGIMQAYGEKFGGSLSDDQINKLAEFLETLAH